MDAATKKRINECVERTLLYNSGKKFSKGPLFICCLSHVSLLDKCDNNCNYVRTPGEVQILSELRDSPDNCYGCAFSRYFNYVSEALSFLKTTLAMDSQCDCFDPCREAGALLERILILTRTSCYLTFTEQMFSSAMSEVNELSHTDMYNVILKMYNFCKENNIK